LNFFNPPSWRTVRQPRASRLKSPSQ
jgi:hypothetical protein